MRNEDIAFYSTELGGSDLGRVVPFGDLFVCIDEIDLSIGRVSGQVGKLDESGNFRGLLCSEFREFREIPGRPDQDQDEHEWIDISQWSEWPLRRKICRYCSKVVTKECLR